MKTFKSESDRAEMEDALKHLWVFEQNSLTATDLSVAGALESTRERARVILIRLKEAGLALSKEKTFTLTDAGRDYALQILRAHRLYETYLANETGIIGRDWHAEAERVEHELSPEDTNRLAKRLGHPRYDPHGDPIPTRQGKSPAPSGIPLASLKTNDLGQILRINDDPEDVFDRLCATGIAPNLKFEIIGDQNGDKVLQIAGREIVCDPEMVEALTVEKLAESTFIQKDAIRLSDLEAGQEAEVITISPACRGSERRRLLDLGFVHGVRIEVELAGIFKSPVAYRIHNTVVALRDHQTENIFVRPLSLETGLEN